MTFLIQHYKGSCSMFLPAFFLQFRWIRKFLSNWAGESQCFLMSYQQISYFFPFSCEFKLQQSYNHPLASLKKTLYSVDSRLKPRKKWTKTTGVKSSRHYVCLASPHESRYVKISISSEKCLHSSAVMKMVTKKSQHRNRRRRRRRRRRSRRRRRRGEEP